MAWEESGDGDGVGGEGRGIVGGAPGVWVIGLRLVTGPAGGAGGDGWRNLC